MSTEVETREIDPRVERKVWSLLGTRTVREIASEAGVTPEEVLRIKRQMLDEIDVLTIQEKRAKLLSDLEDIARRTQDDYDAAPWEFKSGIMNSSISAMKTVMGELRQSEKADNSAVEALNQLRVRELVALMTEVVDEGVRKVASVYDLDENEIFTVFNRLLFEAAEKRDFQG